MTHICVQPDLPVVLVSSLKGMVVGLHSSERMKEGLPLLIVVVTLLILNAITKPGTLEI